jgi:hypothetical protein
MTIDCNVRHAGVAVYHEENVWKENIAQAGGE